MKTTKFFICTLGAACALAACTKEAPVAAEKTYKASFRAEAAAPEEDELTKVSVAESGIVTWVAGDKVRVQTEYSTSAGQYEFTNSAANVNLFDGTVTNVLKSYNRYIYIGYPYDKVGNWTSKGICEISTAPASQTGKLADLGSYLAYICKYDDTAGGLTFDESNNTVTFNNDVKLQSLNPVIKFNVPAALGARKITIDAELNGAAVNTADAVRLRYSTSKALDYTDGTTETIGNVSAKATSTITIDNGSLISGDVYAALVINQYRNKSGAEIDRTRFCLDKFKFTVYNSSEESISFNYAFGQQTVLNAGKIYTLPDFPSSFTKSALLSSENFTE